MIILSLNMFAKKEKDMNIQNNIWIFKTRWRVNFFFYPIAIVLYHVLQQRLKGTFWENFHDSKTSPWKYSPFAIYKRIACINQCRGSFIPECIWWPTTVRLWTPFHQWLGLCFLVLSVWSQFRTNLCSGLSGRDSNTNSVGIQSLMWLANALV